MVEGRTSVRLSLLKRSHEGRWFELRSVFLWRGSWVGSYPYRFNEPRWYSAQLHTHSKEERLIEYVRAYGAHEVDEPKPGDIALYLAGGVARPCSDRDPGSMEPFRVINVPCCWASDISCPVRSIAIISEGFNAFAPQHPQPGLRN